MIYANEEKIMEKPFSFSVLRQSSMYDSLFMDNYLNPAIGKGLAFLS